MFSSFEITNYLHVLLLKVQSRTWSTVWQAFNLRWNKLGHGWKERSPKIWRYLIIFVVTVM